MPEVSRFFGIIIRRYFDDHPPPHFHAIYAEHEAQIGISPITLLNGSLPAGQSRWLLNGRPFTNQNCLITGSG